MNYVAALFFVGVLAGYPLSAGASFYRYYDENGGVTVTNDYKSIPERYRVNVVVTTEKELEHKTQARERQSRTDTGRSVQQQPQNVPTQGITVPLPSAASPDQKVPLAAADSVGSSWLSRQIPLLKVMGTITLLIAAAVVVGRFVSALAPRPMAIVIRVALFAAVAVYLLKGMSGKITDAFARIKEESGVAQKAVDKRSEKIQLQAD